MVGAIADGDRRTRDISSDVADCEHLQRGSQQTFVTSLGDGAATSFGWFFSLQGRGLARAFCCDEKPAVKLGTVGLGRMAADMVRSAIDEGVVAPVLSTVPTPRLASRDDEDFVKKLLSRTAPTVSSVIARGPSSIEDHRQSQSAPPN